MLQDIRNGADSNEPVFASQKDGALDTSAVWRIVHNAAQCAGIDGTLGSIGSDTATQQIS